MRLIAPEIPDDPAELPAWLDRHVAGLELASLVAELEAVHGSSPSGGAALDGMLGAARAEVLERGLAALAPEALRTLLRHPRRLLELQELVLAQGGPYWERLAAADPGLRAEVERGRAAIMGSLTPRAVERAAASEVIRFSPQRSSGQRARPWLAGLAAAAAVLTAVGFYGWTRRPAATATASAGWGWSRPGALPQDLPPAAYLDRLADDAHEWFNKRPQEPGELARRIGEFRQGCSVLVFAEHRPLAARDRTWLVEKCRAWAAKLDRHLADLEAGADPLEVRKQADTTVNRLIDALRERAQAMG